jgi:copper chaperone CopZ
MKTSILILLLTAATALAESSVTVTGVHNCCKGCDNGILKAVNSVEGASATTKKDEVTIKGKDDATVKAAISALLAAGYAGKGAEAPVTEAQAAKVKSASVSGVHLCCGKCVKAADAAVKSVAGVTSHNAEKGSKSFTVEGDFSPKDLIAALNKAGLNGAVK